MANIIASTSDYWIKSGALTIGLNAIDNPQYVQASVMSGAAIMAYRRDIIGYDASHNYRKWTLEAYNTFFQTTSAKFLHAQLDRKEDGTRAILIYADRKIDIEGRVLSDEDTPSADYYFIYLGSLTSSINNNGISVDRRWDDSFENGTLATDQYLKEESSSTLEKMFRLNEVTGLIEVLKPISEAVINKLKIGKSLFFGEKEIMGIKRSVDTDEDVPIDDKSLTTSKYVEKYIAERSLSRLNDDNAGGHLTLEKGATSKELFEANNGLVVRKTELVEPMVMSLLSEEFEDGIVEENEDVFIEELSIRAPGSASTLGELDNVDDDADSVSDTDDILVRLAGTSEWTINTALFSQVSQLMSKVFPFTMTLSGGGTYEKGSSQTINLSWTYDRDIESQSINNESLLIGIRAKQYVNVVTDTTYTLKAIQGGQTYTKSVSAQFKMKKYYGVSANVTLTNDDILALSSTWAGRTQGSTTFDCTGGKYPYYILPTSMVSGIQFWIGGLRNTDWNGEIREVLNAYGYKESYTIYRLNSIQTGVLNIEVK